MRKGFVFRTIKIILDIAQALEKPVHRCDISV